MSLSSLEDLVLKKGVKESPESEGFLITIAKVTLSSFRKRLNVDMAVLFNWSSWLVVIVFRSRNEFTVGCQERISSIIASSG